MTTTITPPEIDPRDEDELVAATVDAFPDEITDRSPSSREVKLAEALGAFYAATVFVANQIPERLTLLALSLLGITRIAATAATVSLDFTATAAGATVPAGTIVTTGPTPDDLSFATVAELVLAPSATDSVLATATTTGVATNVGANTLETLDEPVVGVDAVTNPAAASGGGDLEAIEATKARAALESRSMERAITAEDFELHARNISGVVRAVATAAGSSVSVHVLADEANERWTGDAANVIDQGIRDAVELDAQARTLPGVVVTALQHAPRVVALKEVEVELSPGALSATVLAAILEALADELSAIPTLNPDGTVDAVGRPWRSPLYYNELVVLVDGVEGVERVGAIELNYSDDWGATALNTTGLAWSSLEAAADGLTGGDFSLIHFDLDDALGVVPTLTELA